MITEKRVQDWKQQIETISEAIDLCLLEVNEWESEFIDSVSIGLSHGKEISFKQSSVLRKIYDRIE